MTCASRLRNPSSPSISKMVGMRTSGTRFDLVIGIHETEPQPLGQHPSDRRFPGPHQADKVNVLFVLLIFHDAILP